MSDRVQDFDFERAVSAAIELRLSVLDWCASHSEADDHRIHSARALFNAAMVGVGNDIRKSVENESIDRLKGLDRELKVILG